MKYPNNERKSACLGSVMMISAMANCLGGDDTTDVNWYYGHHEQHQHDGHHRHH